MHFCLYRNASGDHEEVLLKQQLLPPSIRTERAFALNIAKSENNYLHFESTNSRSPCLSDFYSIIYKKVLNQRLPYVD